MDIMQTKIGEVLNRAKQLSWDEAWLSAFDNKLRSDILNYIKKDQLTERGVDETGNVIGTYSFLTELISQGRKQEGDHYTLEDTGAFYDSMMIVVTTQYIEITADAQKDDDNLFEKYGTGIIGLTEENMDKLVEQVKIRTIEFVRKMLLGS